MFQPSDFDDILPSKEKEINKAKDINKIKDTDKPKDIKKPRPYYSFGFKYWLNNRYNVNHPRIEDIIDPINFYDDFSSLLGEKRVKTYLDAMKSANLRNVMYYMTGSMEKLLTKDEMKAINDQLKVISDSYSKSKKNIRTPESIKSTYSSILFLEKVGTLKQRLTYEGKFNYEELYKKGIAVFYKERHDRKYKRKGTTSLYTVDGIIDVDNRPVAHICVDIDNFNWETLSNIINDFRGRNYRIQFYDFKEFETNLRNRFGKKLTTNNLAILGINEGEYSVESRIYHLQKSIREHVYSLEKQHMSS